MTMIDVDDGGLYESRPQPPQPIILHPDDARHITGQDLPADLFKFLPFSNKVLVVREPDSDREGLIWKPETAKEPLQVGWVVAVGPTVGATSAMPFPREQLLGRKVVFGLYSGSALQVGRPTSGAYDSPYLVMRGPGWANGQECEGDLWGVVTPEEEPDGSQEA